MRILRFLSLTVLFLAAFAVAVGVWTVRRSFPVTAGTAVLPGRDGPVTVARHRGGRAPHHRHHPRGSVPGPGGFVHAQDRFWQMDLIYADVDGHIGYQATGEIPCAGPETADTRCPGGAPTTSGMGSSPSRICLPFGPDRFPPSTCCGWGSRDSVSRLLQAADGEDVFRHGGSADEVLFDDPVHDLDGHAAVPGALRVDDTDRTGIADAEAVDLAP